MAGDWIKMRGDLMLNPKLIAMARRLNEDASFRSWMLPGADGGERIVSNGALRCVTCAALLRVWSRAREFGNFVGDDLVLDQLELSDIDQWAEIPGVGEAMAAVGWVDVDDRITLRNFRRYNAAPMTNAERQKAYRNRNRNEKSNGKRNGKRNDSNATSNGGRVTNPLPEQSRVYIQQQQTISDSREAAAADFENVEDPNGAPTAETPELPPAATSQAPGIQTANRGPNGQHVPRTAAERASEKSSTTDRAVLLLVESGLVAEADAAAIAAEPNASDTDLVERAIAITLERRKREPGVNNAGGLIRELIRRKAPWPPELAADRDAEASRREQERERAEQRKARRAHEAKLAFATKAKREWLRRMATEHPAEMQAAIDEAIEAVPRSLRSLYEKRRDPTSRGLYAKVMTALERKGIAFDGAVAEQAK